MRYSTKVTAFSLLFLSIFNVMGCKQDQPATGSSELSTGMVSTITAPSDSQLLAANTSGAITPEGILEAKNEIIKLKLDKETEALGIALLEIEIKEVNSNSIMEKEQFALTQGETQKVALGAGALVKAFNFIRSVANAGNLMKFKNALSSIAGRIKKEGCFFANLGIHGAKEAVCHNDQIVNAGFQGTCEQGMSIASSALTVCELVTIFRK